MKLSIKGLTTLLAVFLLVRCEAQIQHAASESVKVYGNCGMCEKNIEKAAFKKGEAKADWDQESKMAVITFDSSKTDLDAVLKRIAAAGYDSDKFRADDNAYGALHTCCQYIRPEKVNATQSEASDLTAPVAESARKNGMVKKVATPAAVDGAALNGVYKAYFALKDALVATDAAAAATHASELFNAVTGVKTDVLTEDQRKTWSKYHPKLSSGASDIRSQSDVEPQRKNFVTLSRNMYEVMKVIKPQSTVYLDHCPMYNNGKGADWLSMEKGIKNPYYGKSMLTCGSVKETVD